MRSNTRTPTSCRTEVDQRLGEIETALAAFERPVVYDPAEIARAGVFVSIDGDGDLRIERGYVRREDEPPVEPVEGGDGDAPAATQPNGPIQRTVITIAGGSGSHEPETEAEEDDGLKPLSERLITELTAQRTLALRDALANDPGTAFAAVLHTLCLGAFYRMSSGTCLEISAKSVTLQHPGAGIGRQRLGQGDRGPPSAMGKAVAQGRRRSLGDSWRRSMATAKRRCLRIALRSPSTPCMSLGTAARDASLMPTPWPER